MNRQYFTSPFLRSKLPAWRCPSCSSGVLSIVEDSLRVEETVDSKMMRGYPDWEIDWIRQKFSALLRCISCKEPVFMVGETEIVEDDDEKHGSGLAEALAPTFFTPHIPIIVIPEACAKKAKGVASEISDASALFWGFPPSAGNRIRAAVERLMDYFKIPRKVKTKAGRSVPLTLHQRIERYSKKNQEVGDKLLAIKWLGNTGSHPSDLTKKDVLDAFELLSNALDEIFDRKSQRLKKLASEILKKKGPVKSWYGIKK